MNEVLEITREQKKMTVADASQGKLKRVPIIGAGFAGMAAARALRKCEAEIVLIDRRNHHILQPLLYQEATAVLAPSEIAAPIRQLTERQRNLSVMWTEVRTVNLGARTIEVDRQGVPLKKIKSPHSGVFQCTPSSSLSPAS
jgi:NADH dehydrogenase